MNTNKLGSKECGLISPLINIAEELKSKDCVVILNTIETIALNAVEGLRAFQEKKLSLLDPSVGDQACQIRALMIVEMANQNLDEEIVVGRQELLKLCANIREVRTKWDVLDEDLEGKRSIAKQEIDSLGKIQLNQAKDSKLLEVKKGSPESKKIWEEFSKQMKAISALEAPIKERLNDQVKENGNLKKRVLAEASLDTSLSQKVRQLIFCYILTKGNSTRIEKIENRIVTYNHENVKNLLIGNLIYDGKLLEQLISRAKTMLNLESVDFLVQQSLKLTGKRAQVIRLAMQAPLSSAKKDLKEYSFYHGCELVIKRAQQLGVAILIKSRRCEDLPDNFSCKQLYVPEGDKKKYKRADSIQQDQPVLVIEGLSQRALNEGLQRMVDEAGGLMKMIRLNLAQHGFCTAQQIADPSVLSTISTDLGPEISRLEQEKQRAISLGYSQVNPSSYMIDHIYVDMLTRQNQ